MYKLAYILAAASWLLTFPAMAQGAVDSGQILGVVKDPDQAVVSGALVTLTNQQTRAKSTALSDSQGSYKFLSLQPGAYGV